MVKIVNKCLIYSSFVLQYNSQQEEVKMIDSVKLSEELGVSKTVYALYYPEVRRIVEEFASDFPHHMYEEAWTKKQDEYHKPFVDGYKKWANPIVTFPKFKFSYPTNGSSEAIRESLALYSATGRSSTIHIFKGEYEGYEAVAAGYNLSVIRHDRDDWEKIAHCFSAGEQFYISQPSAIDGNVWKNYNKWMRYMLKTHPQIDIMLDLCYVGCVPTKFKVKANYSNIAAIFFSLSKAFGVYYHRIGGVYSRNEIPGLWGNIWFKNLASLEIGRRLIEAYGPYDIAKKYYPHKLAVIAAMNQKEELKDTPIQSSDVILLGNSVSNGELSEFMKRDKVARWCLTSGLASEINGDKK